MPAWSASAAVEWIARRDRAAVLVGLAVTVALAWAWLLAGAGMNMSGSAGGSMAMPGMTEESAGPAVWGSAAVVFAMWTVMMIAMMLPSAAPTILLFAALSRSRASTATFPPVTAFAAGYLLVWTSFSLVAAAAHLTMRHAALLSPMLRTTNGILSALLLIAAGVYQFTPLKAACLRNCRSPIQFLTRYWRRGTAGALRLGLLHGGYCLGCCWALMGLLFVGGVMNLWWIAAVAAFILIEKVAFLGAVGGRIASGAGLVAAGAAVLAWR